MRTSHASAEADSLFSGWFGRCDFDRIPVHLSRNGYFFAQQQHHFEAALCFATPISANAPAANMEPRKIANGSFLMRASLS